MSRSYDMIIKAKNIKPDRINAIQSACSKEWPFEGDDFSVDINEDETRDLNARAISCLAGGECEAEFADRISVAIWKANEGYCPIEVYALYLDDMPFDDHNRDEEDYKRLMEHAKLEAL